jgi:hypothetical protein
MKLPDSRRFLDVADIFKIGHASIVEKDYFAVQLLKLISSINLPGYKLVFAGGTCLTKAHLNTYRMSEDIDIKLVPDKLTLQKSRSEQRKLRSEIHNRILELIQGVGFLNIRSEPKKLNEGRFQQFFIDYPKAYKEPEVLRSSLQLEVTESILLQPAVIKPIRSMYVEIANEPSEVPECVCAELQSIASEKFISLLRRTASVARDTASIDDPALVRHVYDLHLILQSTKKRELIKSMISQVIEIDLEQFGSQHSEFAKDPKKELKFGLQTLKNNPLHKERYQRFNGPLVYHPNPADWETAFDTLEQLAAEVL